MPTSKIVKNTSKAGDGKFTSQNNHQRPSRNLSPLAEHGHAGNGQQLVRQGIQKFTEIADLIASPGDLPIHKISQTCQNKYPQSDPHPVIGTATA